MINILGNRMTLRIKWHCEFIAGEAENWAQPHSEDKESPLVKAQEGYMGTEGLPPGYKEASWTCVLSLPWGQ